MAHVDDHSSGLDAIEHPVEAIADAVPSLAEPRVCRAQRGEVAPGLLLIENFQIHPAPGVTALSQLTMALTCAGWP